MRDGYILNGLNEIVITCDISKISGSFEYFFLFCYELKVEHSLFSILKEVLFNYTYTKVNLFKEKEGSDSYARY